MNLQQFQYDGRNVRIQIGENGKEWFCAGDVTQILGYKSGRQTITDICLSKGVCKRDTLTGGGNQQLTYIDEPNLFRLIVGSKLPKAQEFEAFVFEEVLPSIRKTGSYSTGKNLPTNYAAALRELADTVEEKIRLELENAALQPAKQFFDTVTQSDDEIDMGEAAKVLNLGFGRTTLFKHLREMKILMKDNIPYQRFVDLGYFRCVEEPFIDAKGKPRVNVKTVVLQKGVAYLISVFKTKALAA